MGFSYGFPMVWGSPHGYGNPQVTSPVGQALLSLESFEQMIEEMNQLLGARNLRRCLSVYLHIYIVICI